MVSGSATKLSKFDEKQFIHRKTHTTDVQNVSRRTAPPSPCETKSLEKGGFL